MIEKNQIYTVSVENMTIDGYGICRIDGRAVFIPAAVNGETWEIKILKVTSAAIWAKGLQCLNPSPKRIPNDCANPCGGCALRHIDYETELTVKQEHVKDCLKRIGNIETEPLEIHPSPFTQRYRNKAIFAVGTVGDQVVFGFFRPRSHDIIPVEDCLLQSERCLSAGRAVTDFMNRNSIPAYDEKTGKGTVRHIYFRESRCGDAILCIVSARGFGGRTQELTDHIRKSCPGLTGIVLNINKNRGNTVLSGDFYTLWGSERVRETFCGYTFLISSRAFLQVNPQQAEAIYRKAADLASGKVRQKSTGLALELYCGAGTVSLCLSAVFQRVIAAEIVPEAIENARNNAECNGVSNIDFICADAAEVADRLSADGLRPDAVLVDPPRKGLSEQVILDIVRMQPERIVYISCNPATLARDLSIFSQQHYSLDSAESFDMFPRTGHCEVVVSMSRDGVRQENYCQ